MTFILLQSDKIDVDFIPESDNDLSENQKSDINHILFEFDDILVISHVYPEEKCIEY